MSSAQKAHALAEGGDSFHRLLNDLTRAREEARRLNLDLVGYLLDVACLDLSQTTTTIADQSPLESVSD